jgi:hypothetical protein
MGKGKKNAVAAAPTGTEQKPVEKNQAVTPQVIKAVAPNKVFRGARAAWYAELRKYEGKPVAEFYKATAEKPPSLPKSGVKEKPSGWLGWFVRSGIATLS